MCKAKRIMSSLLPALALLAAGCVPGTYWDAGGNFEGGMGAFRYAGADRDFRTAVVGNPFAVTPAETERVVLAAMQGQDKGMRTHFTATPKNPYQAYHIVMLFNPTATGSAACADPKGHAGTGRGGTLSLAALFCFGDRIIYGIGGTIPSVDRPDDPRFRAFLNNLMDQFVPFDSMVEETDDDDEM